MNPGAFSRADWLKAMNMEAPRAIADLEKHLYAAKDAKLGGELGYGKTGWMPGRYCH